MLAFLVLINKIKTFFKKNKYLSWDEWIYISLFLLMNSNIITSFAWSRIITFLIYGDQCSRKEKKRNIVAIPRKKILFEVLQHT